MDKTIICIPCYNEEKRLNCAAFIDFAKENSNIHFLFVNDGSVDNTKMVLDQMATACENIQVLHLVPNGGKAEAVRRGMLYAYENLNADYIGFWDADLATPLNEIPQFLNKISENNFDAVIGLRLLRLGAKVKRKWQRHLFGRVFATVVSLIVLRINSYDTQCGAKLFRAALIPSLFTEKFVSKWFFDIEILARYKKINGVENTNNKIYEYPVFTWEDVSGSQLKLRDFITAPLELLKIKRQYL